MKRKRTREYARLLDADRGRAPWRKWGPYLSERQWGTVREDYSESGNAWDYFTHDQARSRAYRWGEDGLGGISDDRQFLCFALALWNGNDPIIKERLFGLTNSEGNHGEDVKEYYFYLDSTPTHSYMKYLYKYPQQAYPYDHIVATNKARGKEEYEYELLETGVFDGGRYFDVFVEYAKASPEDILIRISAVNRGPAAARLHLLPTLWFRNTWFRDGSAQRPALRQAGNAGGGVTLAADHPELGVRHLAAEGSPTPLFTENETNTERVFGTPNPTPFVKDAFNSYLVRGKTDAVNPERRGTRAALHYALDVQPGDTAVVRLRLSPEARAGGVAAKTFDAAMEKRRREADEFYAAIAPAGFSEDRHRVFRQALAGMLWGKQYYDYDVEIWLAERGAHPFAANRKPAPRNEHWYHMVNQDIISMPDKWEYPWYAAWDLAFHVLPLTLVDVQFAKSQLDMMLRETYMHPNGQLPAYEWNFSDVNPPVHAWATMFAYDVERAVTGTADVEFLKNAFQKLLLNFTWWVNRKDPSGKNVFNGGFLGLDNIGVFDRSAPLPKGGTLEQADGTAWMAFFSQMMLQIGLELAGHDRAYEGMTLKFLEHFYWIASSLDRMGDNRDEMWDEEDGFFYDILRMPDGRAARLKVRSLVGLMPLCAVSVVDGGAARKVPGVGKRLEWLVRKRPELFATIQDPRTPGPYGGHLLSIVNEKKLRRILARMLDEKEFLSPHGIRSLSRHHKDNPYVLVASGEEHRVAYLPAESDSGMFGGNSNWRGPVWVPINALLIRALLVYYRYYGDTFTVECPTGSGNRMNLYQVAEEIARRLERIFLRDEKGRRPVYGDTETFQQDPHWRDLVLFYEYFHGDNGAGIGASHQTGWTGLVAALMTLFGSTSPKEALTGERGAIYKAKAR